MRRAVTLSVALLLAASACTSKAPAEPEQVRPTTTETIGTFEPRTPKGTIQLDPPRTTVVLLPGGFDRRAAVANYLDVFDSRYREALMAVGGDRSYASWSDAQKVDNAITQACALRHRGGILTPASVADLNADRALYEAQGVDVSQLVATMGQTNRDIILLGVCPK